jgi:DNA-binding NtrC family response regulator
MSRERPLVGVVEDDPIMGESLSDGLELEGLDVVWWRSGAEALAGIGAARPDVVLCDIRLSDMGGDAVFAEVGRAAPAPPFIFMTAYAELDQAVAMIRQGAADYIAKPFAMADLIERARAAARRRGGAGDGALGVSPAMEAVERMLARLAPLPTTVVFRGETGVGKEVCARRLHALSCPDRPFVPVNCAAIPAELVERELFGAADGGHAGYAAQTADGVLFLDEIAELAPAVQPKLLRLVEDRRFRPLGAAADAAFEARVLCATKEDLAARVEAGLFRADLFFRLNIVEVAVPPLRERPEDVPWLLDRFVAEFARRYGAPAAGVSDAAEAAAVAHDWPGNVRELRNRVERAVALGAEARLTAADLFPERARGPEESETLASLAEAREAAENAQILRALKATGGGLTDAARLLGVSRTTLWEKMRRMPPGMRPR